MNLQQDLGELSIQMDGELHTDSTTLISYATDASAYRAKPIAVALPRSVNDLKILIHFAQEHQISLIPRAAGTSLAGQVVGNGLVVDISKYFTDILEINVSEQWVRVQPGVILDELNMFLEPYGMFFGPETSTSNRCMIGGMVGNNSCGSHSILYGSTRDHLLEVKGLLSNNEDVTFRNITIKEFKDKCTLQNLEGEIYRNISTILSNTENQDEIRNQFPIPELKRRNHGYALDLLLETQPFADCDIPFNFSKLIAGSEGTLMLMTEFKLHLEPLPPTEKGVICVHLKTIDEAMQANLVALKYNPGAVELMDNVILNLSKDNIAQQRNRFFVQGDPGAILIIEFARNTREEISTIYEQLVSEFKTLNFGYHFPILFGADINKVWALRKSGLGILSNMQGDHKPVSVIEDTAVIPQFMPDYINDFKKLLQQHNLQCVYHAHIGSGELHLRPMLNLKDPKDIALFRTLATDMATLVKKYRGSLSGEHGDGRLRGEFIPMMIGEHNYSLLREIKKTWDPHQIFNKGKIINTPPMNSELRYLPGQETRSIKTYFDFSSTQGIVRASENCNGSGDCRKSALMGGVMCPSYMVTRNEKDTTRARANVLREFLTNSTKKNPFDHKEIYEILDLCISCKGCKSECPSNVDMAKLKAEFLQHYHDANGIPLRTLAIAYITHINKIASFIPFFYNAFVSNKTSSLLLKRVIGFAEERSIPKFSKQTLYKWLSKNLTSLNNNLQNRNHKVFLFVDEFTNYNELTLGITAVKLLNRLGYFIEVPEHMESGRTFLSKGLVKKAQKIATKNVMLLKNKITPDQPLIGIEPSCILTFRDEYPDLVASSLKDEAKLLGSNALFIDDFISREFEKNKFSASIFTENRMDVKFHGHCQQKALLTTGCTQKMLSIPVNYSVKEIKSGCCGMAGSFGYEKEHYDLSMKIGELVLFPEIRKTSKETIIAAPGTSCRHHIKDGTGLNALHPLQVLYKALK